MLEITVDRFKDLEEALSNFIQINCLSPESKYYSKTNRAWRNNYKNNKYRFIISLIMLRYGSIKFTRKNEIIIAKEGREVYKIVHKCHSYRNSEITKHNLALWIYKN